MTLKELNDKRLKLVADARAALDEIKSNTEEARSVELETRHDTIMGEFDKLDKLIERQKRVEVAEARSQQQAEEDRARQRPNGRDTEETSGQDDGDGEPTYRQVFHTFLARGADIGELSEQERTILRRGVAKDAEFRAQSAGTTTAGGYTVPTELSDQIIRSMAAWGPMYDEDICTTLQTSAGNAIKLPTVDDTTVTPIDHTEGTALTDSGAKDVTFGQKSLDSYGYDTEFVRFSLELARDSVLNMEALLASLLGERLGRIANARLTTGVRRQHP